jgi:hypothetical protein
MQWIYQYREDGTIDARVSYGGGAMPEHPRQFVCSIFLPQRPMRFVPETNEAYCLTWDETLQTEVEDLSMARIAIT